MAVAAPIRMPESPVRRQRRSRRRFAAFGGAGVALLAATIGLRGGQAAERPLAGSGPDQGVLASYTVTYDVSVAGTRRTEQLSVRRPFDSRLETVDATGARSVTVARLGEMVLIAGPRAGSFDMAPGPALGDTRLDRVAVAAVRAGLLRAGSVRSVAGHRCREYRTTNAGIASFAAPLGVDGVSWCVDAHGRVLHERRYIAGTPTLERRARTVSDLWALPDEDSSAVRAPRLPREVSGTSVTRLGADREPSGLFVVLPNPPGMAFAGRFAVVESLPGEGAVRRVAITDVWRREADFVALERRGAIPRGRLPLDRDAPPQLGASASEIRLGDGTVRLFGSVPLEELRQLADVLEVREGNGRLGREQQR